MWRKKTAGGMAAGFILSFCLGLFPQPAAAAPVIANMPHRADGSKITTPQRNPKGMPRDVARTIEKPMSEAPLQKGKIKPAATPVPKAPVSQGQPEATVKASPDVKTPAPKTAGSVQTKAPAAAAGNKPLTAPAKVLKPTPPAVRPKTAREHTLSAVPAQPATKRQELPRPQVKSAKSLGWEKDKKRQETMPKSKVKKSGNEAPPAKSVYQVGDKGWKVKQAQAYLQELGFKPKDTEGQFTKSTRKALRKFQKKYDLKVTGNLDNATYTELKWQAESKKYGGNVESLKILKTAAKYKGVHYVWGGTTPKGFDCSGYVQYVFAQHGIKLSRTADTQALEGKHIAKKDLKPGDLVFFSTYEPGASHDGIYAGNGKFWNATSSGGIMLSDLNDSYWGPRYYTARRILRSNDRHR